MIAIFWFARKLGKPWKCREYSCNEDTRGYLELKRGAEERSVALFAPSVTGIATLSTSQ